jgi:iron complex outermembrane receptor protein
MRATLSNIYEWGDYTFVWNTKYIGDQFAEIVNGVGEGYIGSWNTNDVQVNYRAPWGGKFTLGAQNVTARIPPLFLGDTGIRDYDFGLYDAYGRIAYARYTHTF